MTKSIRIAGTSAVNRPAQEKIIVNACASKCVATIST
jgi:hypothetical protein